MSLAVRVPVDPTSILLRGQALAVPMLALAGVFASLSLTFDQSPWWAMLAVVLPGIRALWDRWRPLCGGIPRTTGRHARPRGVLIIDAEGRAAWEQAVPGSTAHWPLEPTSWDLGQQIVSVRGRLSLVQPAPALRQRPVLDLVFTRDALSAGQWRALRVWLLWRQRGGVPGRAL